MLNLQQYKYLEWNKNGELILPNVKKIFIPDEGMELFDGDLSGADIQVVAADSEAKWLLDFFSKPQEKKVYAYIASEFFQRDISDKSDEYKLYKGVFHGTNYLLGITKLASMSGISETLAEELQQFYFTLNPEIRKWHKRLELEVKTRGFITNAFGRRMWFLDKNNPNLMNEVAAGIPQSTIGDVINRAWIKVRRTLPELRPMLMQTHDSLTGQYPYEVAEEYREQIPKLMEIEIPYNPPLFIPADIKVSRISYGDTIKVR